MSKTCTNCPGAVDHDTANCPFIRAQINHNDLHISTYRTDCGSAWVPKMESAVKITHRPTGITVESSSERSQHANKEAALRELARLLADQPAREPVRDDDMVAVPRGLLASAMFAIRRQVEAPNTLAKLREYAHGEGLKIAEKKAPRLIGWRTEDYLMETADRVRALNWQHNIGVLPIFEGDPNTRLSLPTEENHPGGDDHVVR